KGGLSVEDLGNDNQYLSRSFFKSSAPLTSNIRFPNIEHNRARKSGILSGINLAITFPRLVIWISSPRPKRFSILEKPLRNLLMEIFFTTVLFLSPPHLPASQSLTKCLSGPPCG